MADAGTSPALNTMLQGTSGVPWHVEPGVMAAVEVLVTPDPLRRQRLQVLVMLPGGTRAGLGASKNSCDFFIRLDID